MTPTRGAVIVKMNPRPTRAGLPAPPRLVPPPDNLIGQNRLLPVERNGRPNPTVRRSYFAEGAKLTFCTGGQSSKRRKTVDSRADNDTGTDAEILCAWPSIRPEAEAKARGTHPQKEVMSEPVTRAPSIGLPARATSQPSSSRPRIRTFDCVELPTYQEVLSLRRRDRQSASTTPERSRMDTNDRPLPSPFRTPSPDEYSSWDAGASTDELQRIRRELQQGVPGVCPSPIPSLHLTVLIQIPRWRTRKQPPRARQLEEEPSRCLVRSFRSHAE